VSHWISYPVRGLAPALRLEWGSVGSSSRLTGSDKNALRLHCTEIGFVLPTLSPFCPQNQALGSFNQVPGENISNDGGVAYRAVARHTDTLNGTGGTVVSHSSPWTRCRHFVCCHEFSEIDPRRFIG
jgi:hypothetical protein